MDAEAPVVDTGEGETKWVIVEDSAGVMTDGAGSDGTCENTKKEENKRRKRVTMAPHEAAATRSGVVSNTNR